MSDILLVEDNLELVILMEALLHKKGFSLAHVTSGEAALEWLQINQASVLILDIMLPGIDGFTVCQKIREKKMIPILILSARSTKEDQLLGFQLGADDYMKKPIDLDILAAKVQALMNRNTAAHIIHSTDLTIDIDAHKVYLRKQIIDLTSKEFDLLLLLVQNAGKTLHKNYLFHEVWGDSCSEDQTLTVHIKMLRSKIEENPKEPKRIQTVWGIGYRYEEI